MRVIAIIPARGGSVAVPRKNIKQLGSIPLLRHTINHAKRCEYIDAVMVSTEDDEIAEVAGSYGAGVIRRPAMLADGDVMVWEAIRHAASYYHSCHATPDYFVEMHPTYPFRRPQTVDRAIETCRDTEADGVMVARQTYDRVWRWVDGRFQRVAADIAIASRQIQESLYVDCYGLANVYTPNLALGGNPYKGELQFVPLTEQIESFDINDGSDFTAAEQIVQGRAIREI